MTANEITELAARVMRTCEDKAAKVTDPAEQSALEDAYHLAQGVLDLIGPPNEDVPTVEQALALGRFLQPAFRDPHVGLRSAFVARGGAGLPDTYLHVRHQDGYEGGIDREGRVST